MVAILIDKVIREMMEHQDEVDQEIETMMEHQDEVDNIFIYTIELLWKLGKLCDYYPLWCSL